MSIIVNSSLSKLYGDVPLVERYFTVTALEDCELPLTIPAILPTTALKSISYKFAGSNVWKTLVNVDETEVSATISLKAGQSVFLEGDAKQYAYNTDPYPGGHFANVSIVANGKYTVSGNIMSLLYSDDFAEETELPEPVGGGLMSSTFVYLFHRTYGNPNLVDAGDLILPATTLRSECYGYMFEGCTSLTTAPELPATTLAAQCYVSMFHTCTSLTEAPAIPATTLAQACCRGMYQNCSSLKSADFELPATVLPSACYQSMFKGCTLLSVAPTIDEEAITEEAADARQDMFKGCYTLNPPVEPSGKITITENGTDIDVAQYATADVNVGGGNGVATTISVDEWDGWTLFDQVQKYIVSAVVPDGVTELNISAFFNCIRLETVELPDSLVSIGQQAFSGCSSLPTIEIPSSVTSIGARAYQNCSGASGDLILPAGLTSIGEYAFNQDGGLSGDLEIPSTVTTIGQYAFISCLHFTGLTLSSGLLTIGKAAFSGCKAMTGDLVIPNTVTSVGFNAFEDCDFTTATFPDTVTDIGEHVLNYNYNLTSVTLGNAVTIIRTAAFRMDTALTTFVINSTTPPNLVSNAFPNNNNFSVYVPDASVTAYQSASGWSAYSAQIKPLSELPA